LAARVIVVGIVALTTAFLSPVAQAKNKPDDFTRVYAHTFDEVFQAAQNAIEREGGFVGNADKSKGVITGKGIAGYSGMTWEIHIETISAKPETRLTINITSRGIGSGNSRRYAASQFLMEVQKVLATYQ
jgi:hypothetical protein